MLHNMGVWGTEVNSETLAERFGAVSLFLAIWTALYKLQKLLPWNSSPEKRCRVVTLIHGVLITTLSLYSQIIEGPNIFSTVPALENNNTQMTIIKICFGYFLFDISWCLFYQSEHPIMLFHHVLSLFGMFCSTLAQRWGAELVAVISYAEITNPLLQMRWLLKSMGLGDRWYTAVVDWTFIVSFGLFRLVLGSVMLYTYLSNDQGDFLGRFGGCSIYALSWVFYYYILSYAAKKYFHIGLPKSNRIINADRNQTQDANASTHTDNHGLLNGSAVSRLSTSVQPNTFCTSSHLKAE